MENECLYELGSMNGARARARLTMLVVQPLPPRFFFNTRGCSRFTKERIDFLSSLCFAFSFLLNAIYNGGVSVAESERERERARARVYGSCYLVAMMVDRRHAPAFMMR